MPREVRSHIRFRQSDIEEQTAHWIWTGPRRSSDPRYGTIGDHGAHRWIYQKMRYLDEGDRLGSLCRVPRCVNPNHWRRIRPKAVNSGPAPLKE